MISFCPQSKIGSSKKLGRDVPVTTGAAGFAPSVAPPKFVANPPILSSFFCSDLIPSGRGHCRSHW